MDHSFGLCLQQVPSCSWSSLPVASTISVLLSQPHDFTRLFSAINLLIHVGIYYYMYKYTSKSHNTCMLLYLFICVCIYVFISVCVSIYTLLILLLTGFQLICTTVRNVNLEVLLLIFNWGKYFICIDVLVGLPNPLYKISVGQESSTTLKHLLTRTIFCNSQHGKELFIYFFRSQRAGLGILHNTVWTI